MTREEAISYLIHIDTARKLMVANINAIDRMRKPTMNDGMQRARLDAAVISLKRLHQEIGETHQVGGY